MVFGDKPPSDILATRTLSALLLTSDNGRSPISGLIHFSRQPFHSSNVAGNWFALTTLDVVQPPFCLFAECDTLGLLYYLSKCSKVSAPLSATISRARRSLSDLDR